MPVIARAIRNRVGILLAVALALLGGPSAVAQTTPRGPPRPALWLLADEDTKIYLFGTLHVLPPNLVWRSAAIDQVVASADELVMETKESDLEASLLTLDNQLMLGKQVPLTERVSPERRPALRRLLASTGLPADTFDHLQTWVAAMVLGTTASLDQEPPGKSRSSGRPASGVEEVLEAEFARRGRPVFGLETPQMQLGFFSTLPQRLQSALLEQTIDAFIAGDSPTDPDESDWVNGNVSAIGEEMAQLPAEVFAVLLTGRNRQWTDWLVNRLQRPGTVLFAVGAGHLAGRDSVQAMLEARGLTVSRLP